MGDILANIEYGICWPKTYGFRSGLVRDLQSFVCVTLKEQSLRVVLALTEVSQGSCCKTDGETTCAGLQDMLKPVAAPASAAAGGRA